jgi:hypothetical protein
MNSDMRILNNISTVTTWISLDLLISAIALNLDAVSFQAASSLKWHTAVSLNSEEVVYNAPLLVTFLNVAVEAGYL